MSLKQLFERLHNLLREDGITGLDAMRDICYLIGAKSIEPHITSKHVPGKIDLLNPEHYSDERSIALFPNVAFSKWTEIPENQLFEHIKYVHYLILSVHPITENLYSEKFITCQKQSILKTMVEAINAFDFANTDTDVMGDAYEHFLAQLTSGRALGQYFTNRNIVKFILSEIDIIPNSSVYDPCCGTGGFLTEAWKHDKTLSLIGNDISKDTVILGNVNVLMNTAKLTNFDDTVIISKHDSIKDQDVVQYDYILTNPPYGLKVKQKELKDAYSTDIATFKTLYPYASTSSVDLYQQCLLKKMRRGMAVVLPFGSELCSKRPAQIKLRKYLLDNYCLEKVVILPSGAFTYTSIQTCIMFWKPLNSEHTPSVDFYNYNLQTNKKEFVKTVSYAELQAHKYSLNVKEYIHTQRVFSNNVVIKKLGDICEFKRGKSITRSKIITGEYPVIGGGKKPIGYHNDFNMQENTILISSSGSAGYVSMYPVKVWASDCFAVIPKHIDNEFLYYYLKSIQNNIYDLQTGAAQPHVYPCNMEMLDVPVPSDEIQKNIVAQHNKIEKQQKDKMDKLLEEIEQNKQILAGLFDL